jgi:hypothetical protein
MCVHFRFFPFYDYVRRGTKPSSPFHVPSRIDPWSLVHTEACSLPIPGPEMTCHDANTEYCTCL